MEGKIAFLSKWFFLHNPFTVFFYSSVMGTFHISIWARLLKKAAFRNVSNTTLRADSRRSASERRRKASTALLKGGQEKGKEKLLHLKDAS